ncbi:MAG: 50S ribosomal protein L18e [Candidatus Hadarchaeales archaeon]
MAKPTGPTNPILRKLIRDLRKLAKERKARIWEDVADRLEMPRRARPEVNLSQINRYADGGETVVVPGKVLAAGRLTKSVTVAAFKFSKSAIKKIVEAGGRAITIKQLMEENPDGKRVRLMI